MATPHETDTGRATGQKVLISIIDDDESIRESVAGLILWMGFRVATFASGPEFLASPEVLDSACIVSDVQMPDMNGFELHRRLRDLGHSIPTILISAYPNDEVDVRASAEGIIGYLCKPFSIEELVMCVRSASLAPKG
ncbi:response regulator transcription factor [Mesorhizobium sp. RSR565B]|uniref:response regulator transcription factor n=1 Tax=unclassified Mesorhizobium TaxID=325217 RepID=UPI00067EAA5E|nr:MULTISPECIES: response regulator [unclassified Mesorhizobium]WJI70582.1 response regulator [Mesorhizobium sp. C399B]